MAKLPQYQQQQTRRATQGPQLTNENNMGEALGQFAQGSASLLKAQAVIQEREARDYVLSNQNKTSVALSQNKTDLSSTSATGSEYTTGVTTFIEKQKEVALENAPTPKAAEATSRYYDALMAKEQGNAIPVAANINAMNTANIQAEALRIGFNSALQNPTEYETSLQDGIVLIETSDLPDNQKEAAIKQYDNELSYYRFKGQIRDNPSLALNELDSGDWNSRLDPNQLEALTREATNEMKSKKASNTKKLSSDITDYIAYKSSGGEQVTEYGEATLKAVYGDIAGGELYQDIVSANQFAESYNKVAMADGADLPGLLESEKVTGPDNFRTEAGQESKMTAAIKKRNEDLVKDSGLYVLKSPNVKGAFDSYLNTGDGKSFAQTSIAEQERLGLPTGYETILPKKQAANMVLQYEQGGEDAAAFVNELQNQFGDYYPKVLQELTAAGLSPNASVVAILPTGGRAATLLAQADKEGHATIKANITPEDYKIIAGGLDAELAAFNGSTYSEATKAQIKGSTELLAMKYFSSGVYPSAAESLEAAANDVVNERYNFVDGSFIGGASTTGYRIPVELDSAVMEDGVDKAVEALQTMDLMPPTSGLPNNEAQEVYKLNMKAKVLTMNDDSGIVMVDYQNQPIVDAKGNMISYTWEELRTWDMFQGDKNVGGVK
jgi:hypothetical protein